MLPVEKIPPHAGLGQKQERSSMPRETFDRELRRLQDEVLLLGSLVEQAALDAVDGLRRRDVQTARRVYLGDQVINDKRFAIENAVLVLIATQQPMAHDLRTLAAILEVITELERMGDYCKGIALITIRLGNQEIDIPGRDFTRMAELGVDMLHRALSAFVNDDAEAARKIPPDDDLIDELYKKTTRHLIDVMVANKDIIDRANLVMWVCHNLERFGDRVTNICERTIFIATGELLELETSDDEIKLLSPEE
jgi:phosphate transport system protein